MDDETEVADDLRSQLAMAFASQEEPETKSPDKPAADAGKDPTAKADAAAEVVVDKESAGKDDTKPDADAKPAAEEKEPEKAADKKADDDKTDTTAKAGDKIEPPSNWSKRDKEMLARVDDPQVAQWLIEREKAFQADYTKKTQATAQLKKDFEPVEQMLAPHRETLKRLNMTPHKLIEGWMNVERQLMAGPEEAIGIIHGLVNGYKVPLDKLAARLGLTSAAAARQDDIRTGDKPADPQAKTQVELPAEVKKQLDDLDAWRRQQDQDRLTATQRGAIEREAQAEKMINDFKEETDGKGNLLHPFFDEIEADMMTILQGLMASKKPVPPIGELYDRAVHANPETRQKLLTAKAQQEEASRARAARDKAANARKAASSVTGGPSGAGQARQTQTPDRSLRDEIEANLAENEAA